MCKSDQFSRESKWKWQWNFVYEWWSARLSYILIITIFQQCRNLSWSMLNVVILIAFNVQKTLNACFGLSISHYNHVQIPCIRYYKKMMIVQKTNYIQHLGLGWDVSMSSGYKNSNHNNYFLEAIEFGGIRWCTV